MTMLPLRFLLTAVLGLAFLAAPARAQVPATEPFDPSESLLVDPLFLDEAQPDARSLRHILVQFDGCLGAPFGLQRSQDEALALIQTLRQRVLDGEDFAQVARESSASVNAARGGVMGTFAAGNLNGPLDQFLFSAEIGAISEPLLTAVGYHVAQRVDRWAAARTILVSGTDEAAQAKMRSIRERLAAGESFAALATELSDDPISGPRGGALQIFERGPNDRLLKAAAFSVGVGELSETVTSPLGLHLLKRVPVDELDEELRERNWIRARAIVLIQRDTPLQIPTSDRSSSETLVLAEELAARINAGEDFAAIAREYNEDFGDGRARAGDLGWLYRRQPDLSPALASVFTIDPGEVLGPTPTNFGWLLVKRER